jgi:hypothetical protein
MDLSNSPEWKLNNRREVPEVLNSVVRVEDVKRVALDGRGLTVVGSHFF